MEGTRVLITGAARGIGAATARSLVARGARVSLVGLEPELLAPLAEELGDGHAWFEADVTDQASLDAAVAGTVDWLGGIDVVVANAGIAPLGPLATGDAEAYARCVDVNLNGVMRTIRSTGPHVMASQGYVLLVASVAAFSGVPGLGVYGATKAGVESLANTLRIELKDKGVQVASAHPSWIATDMVRDPEAELAAFVKFRARLPWPLHKTTSVEEAGERLADAVAKRKRKVFIPRSISLVERSRRLLNSRAGSAFMHARSAPAIELYEREPAEQGGLVGRSREVEENYS